MFNLFWVIDNDVFNELLITVDAEIKKLLLFHTLSMSDCTFVWGLNGPNMDPRTVGNIFVPFLTLNGTY